LIVRNREFKSIGVAALLVLAGCASTKTQQAPGEYVDDSTVTAKVKAALIADSKAEAHHIDVETFAASCSSAATSNPKANAPLLSPTPRKWPA
jgi:hypothetical protein